MAILKSIYTALFSCQGASPGNPTLLFLIVKAVALVLSRSQDVPLTFDKPRLIEKMLLKLYRQLHVVSQDCLYKNVTY